MVQFRFRVSSLAAIAALGLLGPSCSNSSSSGGGGGASGAGGNGASATVTGSVDVSIPTASTLESEPNDAIDQAQFLDALTAGERIQVFGNTAGGSDVFDAFFLISLDRMKITPEIQLDRGSPADTELKIYDPIAGQFVESIPLDGTSDASFHTKGPFYAVLESSLLNGSNYVLTLNPTEAEEIIPEKLAENGMPGTGQYLGELQVDEGVRISGELSSNTDMDRFVVVIPANASIATSASFEASSDHNIDIDVHDVTRDLFDPVLMEQFQSAAATNEGGTLGVNQLTALEIVVKWSPPPEAPDEADLREGPDIDNRNPVGEFQLPPGPASISYELGISASAGANARLAGRQPLGRQLAPVENEQRVIRSTSQAFGQPVAEAMPGYVVVKPKASQEETSQFLESRGFEVQQLGGLGALRVKYSMDPGLDLDGRRRLVEVVRATIHASPTVDWAEPEYIYRTTKIPNDPIANEQWHMDAILGPEAWDITIGAEHVIVAVIDTGIEDHPDIRDRLFEGYDFVDDIEMALDGDGVDDDPTDSTLDLHGLHVAGTVGATSNNGEGVVGVMWQGRIMPLRVFGMFFFPDGSWAGSGALNSWVANGILYAAGKQSSADAPPSEAADVINMSLGGGGQSQTIREAVIAANAAGVTVIAAAGNDGSNIPSYPAATEGVISVSATSRENTLAVYSNYHDTVDIAAPGGDYTVDTAVWSTYGRYVGADNTFEWGYATNQGTSMASPHVAGVAGLIKAAYPGALPHEVESILTSTATDLGDKGKDEMFGHGLVNTFLAVKTALGESGNPILRVERRVIELAPHQSSASLGIFNDGDGLLLVDEPIVGVESGGNWLNVSTIASQQPDDPTDKRAILIDVDRDGLEPGVYRAFLTLRTNGGTAKMQIHMMVEAPVSMGGDVDLYIAAVNQATGETVDRSKVNPEEGLDYRLSRLPTGTYRFYAGSDDDGDGHIGGAGDRFFGEHEGTVEVAGNAALDLDITVSAERASRQAVSLALAE